MSSHPIIEIRLVASPADRDAAYAVRRRVFQDEQHVPPELEFDADDDVAVLVIALARDAVVGTGRLVLHEDCAKIGRMAVLHAWRKSGAGRAILETLVAEAARRGQRHLVLHAQVHAIGFYQRCGFAVVGDAFDQAGIPHRRMERSL